MMSGEVRRGNLQVFDRLDDNKRRHAAGTTAFLADSVEKVLAVVGTKFFRAADAFNCQA